MLGSFHTESSGVSVLQRLALSLVLIIDDKQEGCSKFKHYLGSKRRLLWLTFVQLKNVSDGCRG